MEQYARVMNLPTLLNTTVTDIQYVKDKREYLIQAQSANGAFLGFTPRHVVLATGIFGNEPLLPSIPSMSSFKGTAYHSSAHTSAFDIPNVSSKKVVIIGAGTSAHDIAEDFVNAGSSDVSIIQRGAIFSASEKALEVVALNLWNTPVSGLTTEEADVVGIPSPCLFYAR